VMDTLNELLQYRPCKRELMWRKITTGVNLYKALREAVRTQSFENAMELVKRWEPFARHSNCQSKWEKVETMVWCAGKVIKDEFEGIIRDMWAEETQLPNYFSRNRDWGIGCIRSLSPDTPLRRGAVYVPVSGWKAGDKSGFLCTLKLEVLEQGTQKVFHHPRSVFSTHPNKDFVLSMKDAWEGAKTLAAKQGLDVQCDGRWSLLQGWNQDSRLSETLPLAAEANNRSASGAAAWGWWFALSGKIPDNRVIVIAQVDPRKPEHLTGVHDDGVLEKTKAIVEGGAFDTIVVASRSNKEQVREAMGGSNHIRVINLDENNT